MIYCKNFHCCPSGTISPMLYIHIPISHCWFTKAHQQSHCLSTLSLTYNIQTKQSCNKPGMFITPLSRNIPLQLQEVTECLINCAVILNMSFKLQLMNSLNQALVTKLSPFNTNIKHVFVVCDFKLRPPR